MPFKFKLSKRLALIKASLAAAGVLTLACTSDLTDPQPPRNPLTQVITSTDLTPLPVASVVASGDDGNIPQNTLDNNLATRWSASGDGQWIRYDLGAVMAVGPVTIAWYRGTEWASAFDIEVSLDSLTWTRVFTGRSSGQTLQPERYDFPVVPGRYVRIVGHGQWSGTTQLSLWNSITETAIYGSAAVRVDSVPVASVAASRADGSARLGATVKLLAARRASAGDVLTRRTVLGAAIDVAAATIAARGLGDGEPSVRERADRGDDPAHRRDEGLGWEPAHSPDGKLDDQQQRGRDGLGERPGDGRGGRLRHDHRDERRAKRDGRHDGDQRAGGQGDGDSIDREPAHGGDGATDGDPDGRPRKSVERTRRHLVEQRPGGGRGERHRVGDGAWDRGGNDHGDERGTERERGRDGDAR